MIYDMAFFVYCRMKHSAVSNRRNAARVMFLTVKIQLSAVFNSLSAVSNRRNAAQAMFLTVKMQLSAVSHSLSAVSCR
jgi:hypothetical protein